MTTLCVFTRRGSALYCTLIAFLLIEDGVGCVSCLLVFVRLTIDPKLEYIFGDTVLRSVHVLSLRLSAS